LKRFCLKVIPFEPTLNRNLDEKPMNDITLRQIEHHMMAASDSHGHSIVIGRSPAEHENWVGVKPSDLFLISVASCATYDVVEILNKQREDYRDLVVTCSGDQLEEPPYTFTSIQLHFNLRGKVNPDRLDRAIRLSITKYCSVISTIRPETPVTYDYSISD
jgi:putative redox protein